MCVAEVLQTPNQIQCSNRMKYGRIEGLCSLLKRFSGRCKYGDMLPRFDRSVLELNLNSNHMLNFVYDNFGHKPLDMNQDWVTPNKLQLYSIVILNKGATLSNYQAFVDGISSPNMQARKKSKAYM